MIIIKENAMEYRNNSFLIATAIDPKNLAQTQEADEEIILLRVTSEYEIPIVMFGWKLNR